MQYLKKITVLLTLLAIYAFNQYGEQLTAFTSPPADIQVSNEDKLQKAFEQQRSNIQIQGTAVVYRLLRDDTKGSRHQKFLMRSASGLSVLVAHNIDLAKKITTLKAGDEIAFYGEYEWSKKGGVIHWTHHDPSGRHIDGWLKHKGVIYQ